MGTKKSNKLYAAAAALAVTASAVAPGLTADAASKVTVKSITAPKSISHYGGYTFAVKKLSLPKTVKVLLSNKKYENRSVKWGKVSYDKKYIGKYQTISGTVSGTTKKASIKVKLNNYPVDVVEPKLAPVAVGEKLNLPSTIDVKYKDGKVIARSAKSFNLTAEKTDKAGMMKLSYNYMGKNSSIKGSIAYEVKVAEITNVMNEIKDDMLSVSADVKYPAKDAKVEVLVYAFKDMTKEPIKVAAELKDGKLTAKSGELPAGTHAFAVKVGEVVSPAKDFVVEAPMVKEVKAINAKQLQVTFNKAIDKATVVDEDGTLKSGVLTVATVSGESAIINTSSLSSLSEDGKTLTVSTDSGFFGGKYVATLSADAVKTKKGEFVAAYSSSVLSFEDTTAPEVKNVERIDSSKVRVYFSEPLSSQGNWTFKLSNGTTVSVTPDVSNILKGYVDLTIDSSVETGSEITATILGAKDVAGNLINPNPSTVKFTKGAKDGVKPVVSSINALGLNKFEVKFSEEVKNVDVTDFSVNGTALTASTGSVAQDSSDKSKYVVTLNTALVPQANQTSVLANVAIAAGGIVDNTGEEFVAITKVVEFKADTVKPTLVSQEVKKEDGKEYLYLKFSEKVTKAANALDALSTKQVKDFVTTTNTADLDGASDDKLVAVGSEGKEFKVALSDVTFNSAALVQGAEYSVTLTGFSDESTNALEGTVVKFTRGSDSDTAKPEIVTAQEVSNNDTIQIQFDRALDGASAVNKANYSIDGLTIDTVTLLPGNIVELKLVSGTNTLSGYRSLNVSNVKSKDGVTMAPTSKNIDLDENVKPELKSATIISNNQIKVVFSEAVDSSLVSKADLDVFVGSVQEDETDPDFAVAPVGPAGANTEFIITLGDALTATEYAQTITVKVVEDANVNSIITDAEGNKVKVGTVVVSK
ncbi:hypothetical protein RSA11_02260 [Exiguobacterium indicum]|uniref:Bacterial Ig-like domain-containing protein n=1 Tax=Exiguobacterium indicum TaxID=296995 RepID=A0AAW3MFY5_9BACL|nr:Ig-like domain-containing protein [Exiguobacterium indicum]KTR28262.1 hypothetical protein RSA11_02260 [Exiguobacterium indicum]